MGKRARSEHRSGPEPVRQGLATASVGWPNGHGAPSERKPFRADQLVIGKLLIRGWLGYHANLHRLFVWQGGYFPKVESRFVWTHHATSLSNLASWRPVSRLTSTFQGQLFHPRLASTGATPQRHGGCLYNHQSYGLRAFSLIPTSCFHGALRL